MKIKPGDLFEWVYVFNNASVQIGEQLYSDSMKKWITCSGLCLCIGTNKDTIHWASDKGLFHARCDGSSKTQTLTLSQKVIPQKIQS